MHTQELALVCPPASALSSFRKMVLVLGLVGVGVAASGASYAPANLRPPAPAREARAAWIATVSNIDWPSRPDLSPEKQRAELIALLDRAAALRLNTIILQVRPACDALYASTIEPWSEYLTGGMGEPPQPFYDPLAFAIDEAHKRGMELHAWFNPYRARHPSARSPISTKHISKTRPNLVREYGKYLWLDPGEKDVQQYSLSVVMDVVRRYDVDGVHFDDYFYPYKERDSSGKELEFPDEASWQRFGRSTGLSRDDWRRENVNTFIQSVYTSVKAAKPWVKFGVSPFGIWRPGHPPQIKGFDPYDKLYADARKWFSNGWLDYFAPQLYWAIDPPEQSYPVLLKWWAEQNKKQRHLWPGMNTTGARRKWKPSEIANQIRLTRRQKGATGHVHWNLGSLAQNAVLGDLLRREVYNEPALVPASPWLRRDAPARPSLTARTAAGSSVTLEWNAPVPGSISVWVIQCKRGKQWDTQIVPAAKTSAQLDWPMPEAIALTAVDRYGNASPAAVVQKKGE